MSVEELEIFLLMHTSFLTRRLMCLQHSLKSVIHTGREKCATQCHDKCKWQVAMEVSMGCDTEIQHKETRADLPSLKLYLSPSSTAPWNLSFSSCSLSQINTSPFQFATVHRILSQRAKNDLISAIAQRSLGIFQRPVIQPHLFGVYTFSCAKMELQGLPERLWGQGHRQTFKHFVFGSVYKTSFVKR